jgi:hypothetical protein
MIRHVIVAAIAIICASGAAWLTDSGIAALCGFVAGGIITELLFDRKEAKP